MFGFYDTYLQHGTNPVDEKVKVRVEKEIPNIENFIVQYNRENFERSLKEAGALSEFNSIYLNFPKALLRIQSELYPLGRTP